MKFVLFKETEGFKMHGDMPVIPMGNDPRVEKYDLSYEDLDLMMGIVDDLDNACNALLDLGDVDYFSGEKLLKLKRWIGANCNSDNQKLNELLHKLNEYVEQAISLLITLLCIKV